MNKQSLSEAFKAMELLNEETFDLDDSNSYDDLQDFIIDDNGEQEISIIDMNAETQEDLLDDYVGQVILDCCVCHSKIYKDKDEIVIDDETQCANIDEECPYCSSMDGFKIIGEVAPYSETEVEVEVEEKDEDEIDDDVEEIETEEEKEIVEESFEIMCNDIIKKYPNKKFKIGKHDILGKDFEDHFDEDELFTLTDNKDGSYEVTDRKIVNESLKPKKLNESYSDKRPVFIDKRKNAIIKGEDDYGFDEYDLEDEFDDEIDESLNEDLKIICSMSDYKPWSGAVDTYNTIVDAGKLDDFEAIMEDMYPDGIEDVQLNDILWFESDEVLSWLGLSDEDDDDDFDESLHEAIENMDIETKHEKIKIKTEEKEDHDNEMIVPLETETEDEIEEEQFDDEDFEDEYEDEEYEDEEASEDEDMVDVDFDEFDEETFDNIGESYLRNVYDNVSSYKTSKVSFSNNNNIIVEGLIKFNSGNVKKTSFVFEGKDVSQNGRFRLIGENRQISRGKKSFTLTGGIKNKKFISESLNYNYRAKDSNGKSTRVYGTQRVK